MRRGVSSPPGDGSREVTIPFSETFFSLFELKMTSFSAL